MSFWTEHQKKIDPERFRAHEQYLGGGGPMTAMVDYIKSIGREHWLRQCGEDGAFGCPTEIVDGHMVSRDLIDSVIEIDLLEKWLPSGLVQQGSWLDIGAGYGRIAHRMSRLFPHTSVACTDAIPISRVVCRSYLHARHVQAEVIVPVDLCGPFDLAMNIHSWPECSRKDIQDWLYTLIALDVPRLFVVPHLDRDMLCNEDGKSFRPDIEAAGYRVTKHWYGPDCWPRDFYLFERE